MRIVFMGTPDFAVGVLQGLIDNYKEDIVGVVSQPDKLVGRHQVLTNTPVKELALKYNIPVIQPIKIREDYQGVLDFRPDIIITCAYGQIIPKEILDYPKYGCINVHASLLPKLRGGAPIHHAIIDGYKKTGITIMEMTAGMDAGKIYMVKETPISDEDDLETLSNRLQIIGRDLLLEFLPPYLKGKIKGVEQDESEVTYAYNIKKEEEEIDWHKEARAIFNQVRGLYPKPATYTSLDNEIVKIYKVRIKEEESKKEPGSILNSNKELVVACGKGSLEILELQPAGKKVMAASQYLNGVGQNLKDKAFK